MEKLLRGIAHPLEAGRGAGVFGNGGGVRSGGKVGLWRWSYMVGRRKEGAGRERTRIRLTNIKSSVFVVYFSA